MFGWMDGWMDGWIDGWTDGWMDGSARAKDCSKVASASAWVGPGGGFTSGRMCGGGGCTCGRGRASRLVMPRHTSFIGM
eukprot:366442-Chlamydomonas_euryale.AAC.16